MEWGFFMPYSGIHMDLQGGGELPAGGGDILAVIIHAAGGAPIQIDGVHAAQSQHQLPHLLDLGAAGDGHQDQLAVGTDSGSGAGRDDGGKPLLGKGGLQLGVDGAVLDQTGAAGDQIGDMFDLEASASSLSR